MNQSELMAWLCAEPQTAFEIWKRSHLIQHPEHIVLPQHILVNYYKTDEAIAQYWNSAIGRFNIDVLAIVFPVKHFSLKRLLWQLSFKFRYS